MRLALLFPGQGSQTVGMGQDFVAHSYRAADVLARADAAYGGGLASLMAEGPLEELTLTRNAQPAILTVSIMAWSLLREAIPDLPVAYAAGHSLGEFSALVAAGVLRFEEAVPLVRDRGDYMQTAVKPGEGAMAACLADEAAVRALVAAVDAEGRHGVLALANFNGPGQVVISGDARAVARAKELGAEHGVKRLIPLEVSAPFHSPLMQPAQDLFGFRFPEVALHDFAFPVVSNLEATANSDTSRVYALGIDQITAPVRWTEICQTLLDAGCDTFVEVGGAGTLTNMLKRGWKDAEITCLTSGDLASLSATITTLKELL